MARGYDSAQEVWAAVRERPGLAVVDSMIAPRRDNWNFGVLPDFQLSGFYFEEGFDPIPVEVLDKQTGRRTALTVIGILKDTAPPEMLGISTSEETLVDGVPGPHPADDPLLRRSPPASTRKTRRRASRQRSSRAGSRPSRSSRSSTTPSPQAVTFNRLIQGFMGLGLIVGVAALGVISARAVVERRQQIGVMRAIGFRRRHGAGRRSCSSPRSSR